MLEAGIETTGTLRPDGAVILDEPPRLAPGRVRVALRPLQTVRLPDPPVLDESIPAPFDLPREGPVTKVKVRFGQPRLPEVFEVLEAEAP